MKNLPNWLSIIFVSIVMGLVVVGAIKTLKADGEVTIDYALSNCLPGFISLIVYVFLQVFLSYNLSAFIALVCISSSLLIFFLGLQESDNVRQNAMFSFAGTAFGFGSGIPIGSYFSKNLVGKNNGKNFS